MSATLKVGDMDDRAVWQRPERAFDELRQTMAMAEDRRQLGVNLEIRSGPLFGGFQADQKRASLLGWHALQIGLSESRMCPR